MPTQFLLICFLLTVSPSNRSIPDARFLNAASQTNISEIEAGKLASAKATGAVARSFAHEMISYHTAAQKELVSLAEKAGVDLLSTPDTEHQNMLAVLQGLSGAAFDSAYWKDQVMDHEVAVTLFEQEAAHGEDSLSKTYATRYLPRLKHHWDMAKKQLYTGR